MTTLSPEAIAEFRELYRREVGEELGEFEAQELGQNLLAFSEIILRRIPPCIDMTEEMRSDSKQF